MTEKLGQLMAPVWEVAMPGCWHWLVAGWDCRGGGTGRSLAKLGDSSPPPATWLEENAKIAPSARPVAPGINHQASAKGL